jgi:hypothetical protein
MFQKMRIPIIITTRESFIPKADKLMLFIYSCIFHVPCIRIVPPFVLIGAEHPANTESTTGVATFLVLYWKLSKCIKTFSETLVPVNNATYIDYWAVLISFWQPAPTVAHNSYLSALTCHYYPDKVPNLIVCSVEREVIMHPFPFNTWEVTHPFPFNPSSWTGIPSTYYFSGATHFCTREYIALLMDVI